MAEASPVEQLKAIASKRGFRVAWQTSHVPSTGQRLRSLQVLDGTGRWVAGASCSIPRDGTVEQSSADCAGVLLGT